MWLFLPFGFFSIVEHNDRPSCVLVRARALADLEAFVSFLPRGKRVEIEHTSRADYPYRVTVTKHRLVRVVERFVHEELSYDNFKDAVARHDPERAGAYMDVWSSLRMNVKG